MSGDNNQGCVRFLDNEYKLNVLEQAINKATTFKIEAGKEFHDATFEQNEIPAAWGSKYKVPVLTMHEGKYVIVSGVAEVLQHLAVLVEKKKVKGEVVESAKTVNLGVFHAKVVTKYNLNDAKIVPVVIPPPERPEPVEPEVRRFQSREAGKPWDKKPPNQDWKKNNGFNKPESNHSNGSFQKKPRFGGGHTR